MKATIKATIAGVFALLVWFAITALYMSATLPRGSGDLGWAWILLSPISAPAIGGLVSAWFNPSRWYMSSAATGLLAGLMTLTTSEGLPWTYLFGYSIGLSLIAGACVWGLLRWLGIGKQ
jgi:hypothetical protein